MPSDVLRVLIVDDSAAARDLLAAAIEAYAELHQRVPEILSVGSGLEALRHLPVHPLDLIVTDINMPDVNGLELIAFARQHPLHHHTPLLVVSTQSAQHDRNKAMALGANAYCEKPVTIDSLTAAFAPLLSLDGGDAE